ncbi:hypothetical protein HMPREF9402_1256 [Turicibacter sp. HGF1]|nr:hypothetical protein HMPREF9402_1256 [Turicibacter sp. HGF1]
MIKISIKFNIGDKKTYYQEIIKDRKKRGYGNLFLRQDIALSAMRC